MFALRKEKVEYMGKTGEILRRKTIGPVKWQPVAIDYEHLVLADAFLWSK